MARAIVFLAPEKAAKAGAGDAGERDSSEAAAHNVENVLAAV